MLDRRKFLKYGSALGAAGVIGGSGLFSFSRTVEAAITTSFDAGGPVGISNEQGNVTNVYLNPTSSVQWENFDVPVTKVRQLLEARVKDSDGNFLSPSANYTPGTQNWWWPIYRETPWLFRDPNTGETADFNYDPTGDGSGTGKVLLSDGDDTPSYATSVEGGKTGFIDYDLVPSEPASGRNTTSKAVLIVSENYPKPDYSTAQNTEAYLSGESIGDANTNVQNANANGQYGTVGNTDDFDNASDGSTVPVTVELRLTTTLHTDYDFVEHNPDDYTQDRYDPLVMAAAPDVGHQFGKTTGFTYDNFQSNVANHPAISVQTAAFDVETTNELADSSTSTSGNAGAD